MMPIVKKLVTKASSAGHCPLNSFQKPPSLSTSSERGLIFKTSKVIATANTPSLKASRRLVSLSSMRLSLHSYQYRVLVYTITGATTTVVSTGGTCRDVQVLECT